MPRSAGSRRRRRRVSEGRYTWVRSSFMELTSWHHVAPWTSHRSEGRRRRRVALPAPPQSAASGAKSARSRRRRRSRDADVRRCRLACYEGPVSARSSGHGDGAGELARVDHIPEVIGCVRDRAGEVPRRRDGRALTRQEAQRQQRGRQAAELDRIVSEPGPEVVEAVTHAERRRRGRVADLTLGIVDGVRDTRDRGAGVVGIGHVRAEVRPRNGRADVDVTGRRAAVAVHRVAVVAALGSLDHSIAAAALSARAIGGSVQTRCAAPRATPDRRAGRGAIRRAEGPRRAIVESLVACLAEVAYAIAATCEMTGYPVGIARAGILRGARLRRRVAVDVETHTDERRGGRRRGAGGRDRGRGRKRRRGDGLALAAVVAGRGRRTSRAVALLASRRVDLSVAAEGTTGLQRLQLELLRLHLDGCRLAATLYRGPDQDLLEAVAVGGPGDDRRDALLVRLCLPGLERAGAEARLTVPEYQGHGIRARVAGQGADPRGQEVSVGWAGSRLRLLGESQIRNSERQEQSGHDDLGLTPHGSSAVE